MFNCCFSCFTKEVYLTFRRINHIFGRSLSKGLNGTICFGGAGAAQTTLFPLSHFPTINFDAYFQLSQAAFWDLVSFTEPGYFHVQPLSTASMSSCCPFIRGMKFHCFLNPPKWPFVLKIPVNRGTSDKLWGKIFPTAPAPIWKGRERHFADSRASEVRGG